jgi:hypothetical protein
MAANGLRCIRTGGRDRLLGPLTARHAHFELLPDHSRPAVLTANSNIVSILFDRTLTNSVAALARDNGCSLFMTALAVLLVLLPRQSKEVDIVAEHLAGRR